MSKKQLSIFLVVWYIHQLLWYGLASNIDHNFLYSSIEEAFTYRGWL